MQHDTPRQPKPASSLPKPSHNIPSRPPIPITNQPRSWAATAASLPASFLSAPTQPSIKNQPARMAMQKPTGKSKGPKANFRLTEQAPLPKADATSVKAAFIKIVPGLKDGIASVCQRL